MVKLNHHFQKLSKNSLFSEVEQRTAAFLSKNPSSELLNLGMADFTSPIQPSVVSALTLAASEMGNEGTLRGYGPSEGYPFLREAIAQESYKTLGLLPNEIFISGGVNTDISNLTELFSSENRVAVPDPSYPLYLETNVIAGRTRLKSKTGRYGGVTYLPCKEENGFQPLPPSAHTDLIYLCSPHNPTGVALTRDTLKQWVSYAKQSNAILIFDGTYEAYITTDAPRSIYEIEGAKEVAIEVRSFSKSAGFTGLRCSYIVIPQSLKIWDAGAWHSLNDLWKQRCRVNYSGISYPIQRGAAALYTPQGKKEMEKIIREYSQRGAFLLKELKNLGYPVFGGIDSPYLWCKTPPQVTSWEFFDFLLENASVVSVPGAGFGENGEGYFRLSAFAEKAVLEEALQRIKNLL